MKNVNMNPDAKLSFLERFAYGIGDYAGNLIYSAISAFLLVYYTNVIGEKPVRGLPDYVFRWQYVQF